MLKNHSNHHQNYSRCKTKKCPKNICSVQSSSISLSRTHHTFSSNSISLQAVILSIVALIHFATISLVQCDPFRSMLQASQHQQQQSSLLASPSNLNNQMMIRDLSGPTSGKIQSLDVICGKNFMTVRAEFSGPFYGIVFSKGTYGQENCIYVKPNSGLTHAAFNVYYDQCGTKPDLQGKFYENTIVIQYGSDIIEAYDEAKRLRCEWFEAYEKPATFKPAIPVADLEVVEMNFQGDDIDCWMEIQEGTGPWSREVSKIVPVGQPMTIVVAINDYNGQFDMRVKSCVAHDGVQTPIALTDEYGCVLRPKMLTPFVKIKNPGAHKEATILSYSRFLAFKFPDSMNVQIQCTVEVCRNGCAEACQRIASSSATNLQAGELSVGTKWPGSAHQPSMANPARTSKPSNSFEPDMANESQQRPTHMELPATAYQQQQQQAINNNVNVNNAAIADSISSSKNSMQQQGPAVAAPANPNLVPQSYGGFNRAHPDVIIPPAFNANRRQIAPIYQQQQQSLSSRQSPDNVAESSRIIPSSVAQSENYATVKASSMSPQSADEHSDSSLNHANDELTHSSINQESQRTSADQSMLKDTIAQASSEPDLTRSLPTSDSQSSASSNNQESISKEQNTNNSDQNQKQQQTPTTYQDNNNKQQSNSDQVESSNSATKQTSSVVTVNQQNDQEADQPPAIYVNNNNEQQQQQQQANSVNNQANSQPNSISSEPKPQDPDMMQAAASNQQSVLVQPANTQQQQQQTSGIQPVEVEIPSNIDESSSSVTSNNNNNNNGDKNLPEIPNASYEPSMISIGSPLASVKLQQQQRILNRDVSMPQAERRGDNSRNEDSQSDDSSIMLPNKIAQFGARSPPKQQSQQAIATTNDVSAESSYASDISSANADAPIESLVSSDRILMDRSDDSSVSIETIPSEPLKSQQQQNENSVVQTASVSGSTAEQNLPDLQKTSSAVHIEDRMGSVANSANISSNSFGSTLEEEVAKLQQQVPQSAALVSSMGQQQQQQAESVSNIVAVQHHENQQQNAPINNNNNNVVAVPKEDQLIVSESQSQQLLINDRSDKTMQANNQRVRDLRQPFPNVAGQSKIISDPATTSQLLQNSARNQMQTAASGLDPTIVLAPPQQQQQQQPQQQPQLSIPAREPKPEVQITNVPVNIAFPPKQLPSIQQLSQQFAYIQQQQQQQQQQQGPKMAPQQQVANQPTAKPSRMRFNLLSPQAALHAVASRLLPKTFMQQQSDNKYPTSLNNNNKQLNGQSQHPPKQQQQSLAYTHNQFNNQQAQFLPGKLNLQQQQQQQQFASGPMQLPTTTTIGVSTLGQQPQQPLIRKRRSAIKPIGTRGSGELGLKKSFMVVTGMDLAFAPNSSVTRDPQILEGRQEQTTASLTTSSENDPEILYGVCMSVAIKQKRLLRSQNEQNMGSTTKINYVY